MSDTNRSWREREREREVQHAGGGGGGVASVCVGHV